MPYRFAPRFSNQFSSIRFPQPVSPTPTPTFPSSPIDSPAFEFVEVPEPFASWMKEKLAQLRNAVHTKAAWNSANGISFSEDPSGMDYLRALWVGARTYESMMTEVGYPKAAAAFSSIATEIVNLGATQGPMLVSGLPG